MKRRPIFVTVILAFLLLTNLMSAGLGTASAASPLPKVGSGGSISPASAEKTLATQIDAKYSNAATINLTTNLQVDDSQGTPITFSYSSTAFVDSKVFDNNHEYDASTPDSCPTSKITTDGFGHQVATVDLWTRDVSNGGTCTEIKFNKSILIGQPELGKTIFEWTSATTIAMNPQEDGVDVVLTQVTSNPKEFKTTNVQNIGLLGDLCNHNVPISDTIQSCHNNSTIDLTITDDNHGTAKITAGDDNGESAGPQSFTVLITNSPTAPASGGPTASGSASPATPQLSCNAGLNPLNWLICGVVNGMVNVVNGLDGIINSLLSVGTPNNSVDGYASQIFTIDPSCAKNPGQGNCTGYDYHAAWASFRDIALGLMVVAGLIMIIAQALGMEILDAYAIRKVLPRLLMVAVGISLSWSLLSFVVQLFNELGYGVRFLIESPFKGLTGQVNIPGQFNSAGILAGAQGAAVLLISSAGVLALGIFGLLTFVASAALAAFIAFLVLVVRQIVVIALVITAPIALVCYILPNTQRAWKLWLDSFGGALMMFPIIAAMIAAGRVFSAVTASNANNTAGTGAFVLDFIAFAAYFAPYFLIPATFKLAGGALRQIGGFVNDRGRGSFDRLRKARQEKTSERVKKARSGGIYDTDFLTIGKTGKYSVGKGLNKLGNYTLDADETVGHKLGMAGAPLLGRYGRQKQGEIDDARIEHNAKLGQQLGGDYRMGWALSARLNHFKSTEQEYNKDTGKYEWTKGGKDGTATAQALLQAGFGTKDEKTGKVTWYTPKTGEQLAQYADILGMDETDKDAQTASALIKSNFHRLETSHRYDDTRRADWETTGLMMAAGKGKLDGDELAETYTKEAAENEVFATKRELVLENASQQQRPELRVGHAVRVTRQPNTDGKPGPGKLVAEAILPKDEKQFAAMQAAGNEYQLEAAGSAISGMTGSQLSAARAETVRDSAQILIHQAGGTRQKDVPLEQRVLNATERSRINDLFVGYTNPYNSPDQKDQFGKILTALGLENHPRALGVTGNQLLPPDQLNPEPPADDGGGG